MRRSEVEPPALEVQTPHETARDSKVFEPNPMATLLPRLATLLPRLAPLLPRLAPLLPRLAFAAPAERDGSGVLTSGDAV